MRTLDRKTRIDKPTRSQTEPADRESGEKRRKERHGPPSPLREKKGKHENRETSSIRDLRQASQGGGPLPRKASKRKIRV